MATPMLLLAPARATVPIFFESGVFKGAGKVEFCFACARARAHTHTHTHTHLVIQSQGDKDTESVKTLVQ